MKQPDVVPQWPTRSKPGDMGFLVVESYPKGKRVKRDHWMGVLGEDGETTWERTGSGPLMRFGPEGGEMIVLPYRAKRRTQKKRKKGK